jgi:DNA-directed RNA polymerase specialized sigma subunit
MIYKNWSKTLICAYPYLERLSSAIDCKINTLCLKSNDIHFMPSIAKDTYDLANTILTLTDRKFNLINLKVLVDSVLNSLPKSISKILILKFIDGVTNRDIASLMNLSIRTVCRKINSSLNSFSYELKRENYTQQKIEEMIKDEKWIQVLYNKFCGLDKVLA